MKKALLRLRLPFLGLLIGTPMTAHAAGADITEIAMGLLIKIAPLWIAAAVLVLVIAGFGLMVTQDEGHLDKTKKIIGAVVIGGILTTIVLVLGPLNFISILYSGVPDFVVNVTNGTRIGEEAIGISAWITAMAAMIGMMFIIISTIRAVVSLGDEGAYQKVRLAILHVVIGLLIIVAAFVIQRVFFIDHTPGALIGFVASKIVIILAIITTIAVAILIYAGVRMIISFGREDDFSAAKSLTIRVAVGLAVILVSYVLVITVALLFR